MRPPALLTTIQTVNNEKGLPSNSRPWLTVAVQRVNVDSTRVALEMSETTPYGKVDQPERVGWIAIEQGIHTLLGSTGSATMVALKSKRVVEGVGNGPTTLRLRTALSASPLVVVSQSTRRPSKTDDGGWARAIASSRRTVDVAIDEDTSCDRERKHGTEQVSVAAFDRAGIF
ncbi:Hypothetical protein (Fragment) [Durusdinium trenchii]